MAVAVDCRVAELRLILAGQKSFGRAVYEAVLEAGHEIAAVWSPPTMDDKLSRVAVNSDVWEPEVNRFPKCVQQLEVDLFVAAHSHDFIGRASRQAARLGGIGYHPSLLPRHRGRDAVRWTIHMGDPVAGGSVYWLTDQVDAGAIAAQDWCFVRPGWDASALWRKRLFPMGVDLVLATLEMLDGGIVVETPQDESVATWEPSWERPPLHRPELLQIGDGVPGFNHVVGARR